MRKKIIRNNQFYGEICYLSYALAYSYWFSLDFAFLYRFSGFSGVESLVPIVNDTTTNQPEKKQNPRTKWDSFHFEICECSILGRPTISSNPIVSVPFDLLNDTFSCFVFTNFSKNS